jgi:hypothetical protein
MRISADENDIGFHDIAHFAEVYIDGEKLELCVTADEERGEAICLIRTPGGAILHDGEQMIREARRGTVTIIIPSDVPAWLQKEWRYGSR